MEGKSFIRKLIEQCDIYYGKDIISGEEILIKYMEFLENQFDKEKKKISFSLHTGSLCFDIVAIIALSLGVLTYNMANNDDILESFSEGDMVLYRNSRYRWIGTTEMGGRKYLVLEQDGKGKNGKGKLYIPYKTNKHLIKPYYGTSKITDSRGIRKNKHDRESFLAWLMEKQIEEIPIELDISVIIVTNRKHFTEIVQNVKIVYNGESEIGLLDIVPASYYTSMGEEHPIGKNPTKTEPVLKITSKISEARSLALSRSGNRTIGVLAIGIGSIVREGTELIDLIRRKNLKFVHVMGPLRSEIGSDILELYEDADVFACTKKYLEKNNRPIKNENYLTKELSRQIQNIIKSEVHPIIATNSGWTWEQYSILKDEIFRIKQSNWLEKEEFVLGAHALLNLFNTSVFTLGTMEKALLEEKINTSVLSPKKRLAQLKGFAETAGNMQESCEWIIQQLEEKCTGLVDYNEKKEILDKYILDNYGKRIVIIVPKAYYVDLLSMNAESRLWRNVTCVTINRYNPDSNYDNILIVGNLLNRKFDPLRCNASNSIDILLYPCEEKLFNQTRKRAASLTQKLNKRLGIDNNEEVVFDESAEEIDEHTVQAFSDLDQYIDSMNLHHLRKFVISSMGVGGGNANAEVQTIGTFITGEQIFFSKNYSPIVYDPDAGSVIETSPEKVAAGDILIFVKRDTYTKNVVDFIYEQLLERKRLSFNVIKATEMSKYWKEALRKYKDDGNYSYKNIATKLKKYGSSLQAVTIRQWLMEDSHIVGPRNEKTMQQIAALTGDAKLLSNVSGYFESCRIVRHQRKEILGLIGRAITDKLAGNQPQEGSVLSVVYDNVENLSEAIELDSVVFLDETVNIPVNLVNRPITETEVLM